MNNGQGVWESVWKNTPRSAAYYRNAVEAELRTVRWQTIERYVLGKWKGFKDLNVIELGCGRGLMSLLMGMQGAGITLVDFNDAALDQARLLFKEFNCRAEFVPADVLHIPEHLSGKFDISMSFGLGEHFTGIDRQTIFDSHARVLRDKGTTFISLPNARCLPYRLYKKALELRGTWAYGFELPFTRAEIRERAAAAGLTTTAVAGSSLLHDIDSFLLSSAFARLGVNTERAAFWDDYAGYALTLIGEK